MANETTLPATTPPSSSGQLPGDPGTNHASAQEAALRASRILSGDVRPDDLLVIPPDVVEFVAASEARGGVPMLPEYRQLMIRELTLQHHHSGDELLVLYVPEGVIVLAAGPKCIDELWDQLGEEHKARVSFAYPGSPEVRLPPC